MIKNKAKLISLNRNCNLSEDSRGATVIEFSLACIILFPLIFAIIDFSKYMWIKSALLKSANSSASVAASIHGFDKTLLTDPSQISALTAEEQLGLVDFSRGKLNAELAGYKLADTVTNISNALRSSLRGMGGTDTSTLRTLPYISPLYDDPAFYTNRVADIAIIRPGERIQLADKDSGAGTGEFVEHTTLCPEGGCAFPCEDIDGNSCPVLNNGGLFSDATADGIKNVYEEHPIMVEMRGEVSTVLGPLLNIFGIDGTLPIKVRAYAFRESFPLGSNPLGPLTGVPACQLTQPVCASAGMNKHPSKCSCQPSSSTPSNPDDDNDDPTPPTATPTCPTATMCGIGRRPSGCGCKGPGS